MDDQITERLKQAKRAKNRWLRRTGITLEMEIKMKERPWWKAPSGERLAREENEEKAYRGLRKGLRLPKGFFARLEEAFYSSDPYVRAGALRLWKEITVWPPRQKRGRPKQILDREQIRVEARQRIASGENKDSVVEGISDRTGTRPSYIRRILEDSPTNVRDIAL